MARKALNAKNLEELGAERLSELVMDLCQGSAALKRQARAALLEASGSAVLADEIRKRLATIKRSKTRVGWRKRKALHTDLDLQRQIITEKIAPRDPAIALELMWEFLGLAGAIFQRTDDSQGNFAALFQTACDDLGRIAFDAKPDAQSLADRMATVLTDHNAYGQFDGLLEATKDTLGASGLSALKQTLARQADSSNAAKSTYAARRRAAAIKLALMQIADLEGNVEAFLSLMDPSARRIPKVATEIALRLLAADRAEEALTALDAADQSQRYLPPEWYNARLKTLDALERTEEAQALRWQRFKRTFTDTYLRDYITHLPDFEDVEAEDRALDLVAADPNVHRALVFLIGWPALERAASLVMTYRETLDGSLSHVLTPAADTLEAGYPLAAVALRRAIIEDTLTYSRSKRYKTAARHLLECESADAGIESYDPMRPHEAFVARLKDRHGRKAKFWDEVWR